MLDKELKSILQNHELSSQQEICAYLKKSKMIFNQSSVSRALQRLGAEKVVNGSGKRVYKIPASKNDFDLPGRSLSDLIVSITSNESLIVIKTTPGSAPLVARFIDTFLTHDVLGTIAGDDSILVVPVSQAKINQTINLLRARLNF